MPKIEIIANDECSLDDDNNINLKDAFLEKIHIQSRLSRVIYQCAGLSNYSIPQKDNENFNHVIVN